jgi:imidazole glycerol-phosphate synthase subunit HisF
MRRVRVIPVLLLKGDGLVKSVRFKDHKYVGDPFNAVRIFNEKEVDELAILDITATKEKREPDLKKIKNIASEAFMPVSYGGGITHFNQAKEILFNGIEKVIINKAAFTHPDLITQIAERFGSQSLVVSIDVKKNIWGKYKVFSDNGTVNTNYDPVEWAKVCQERGAGEILLNFIDRDGTYKGYDITILKQITKNITIPVIACGGAGSIDDFREAIKEGEASAVAAGSMFVFQRPHNAVLISYPSTQLLKDKLYLQI